MLETIHGLTWAGFDSRTWIGLAWAWGVALGIWGWGAIARKLLKKSPAWTQSGLGLALFTGITGWLDLLHQGFRYNLILLLLPGLAAALMALTRISEWKKNWAVIIIIAVASFITLFGSTTTQMRANWDDASGYIPIVHQLEKSGQTEAPFSLRRAVGYGGHFPLQSLGMLWTQDRAAFLTEYGVCIILIGFTLVGLVRMEEKYVNWKDSCVLGGALLVCPISINTAPSVGLIVIGLALWGNRNSLPIAGILAATLVAWRMQTLPTAGLIICWGIWENYKTGTSPRKLFGTTLFGGLLALAFLTPFAINNWQQFETVFWPLYPGTINPEYLKFKAEWTDVLKNFASLPFTSGWWLAGLIIITIKSKSPVSILGWITLGIFLFTVGSMPEYGIYEWRRYSWYLISMALLVGVVAWLKERNYLTATLVICLFLPEALPFVRNQWGRIKNEAEIGTRFDWEKPGRMQLKTKEGSTIAVWLAQANMLDFTRNEILNLDEFSGMRNHPKGKDLKEWKAWIKKWNIDYFLTNDFFYKSAEGMSPYMNIRTGGLNGDSYQKNYRRVWGPARAEKIDIITWLGQNFKTERILGVQLIDVNKELSDKEKKEMEDLEEKAILEWESEQAKYKERKKKEEEIAMREDITRGIDPGKPEKEKPTIPWKRGEPDPRLFPKDTTPNEKIAESKSSDES